ncbi:unnamed protein product, partial [Owenia fusiformis]
SPGYPPRGRSRSPGYPPRGRSPGYPPRGRSRSPHRGPSPRGITPGYPRGRSPDGGYDPRVISYQRSGSPGYPPRGRSPNRGYARRGRSPDIGYPPRGRSPERGYPPRRRSPDPRPRGYPPRDFSPGYRDRMETPEGGYDLEIRSRSPGYPPRERPIERGGSLSHSRTRSRSPPRPPFEDSRRPRYDSPKEDHTNRQRSRSPHRRSYRSSSSSSDSSDSSTTLMDGDHFLKLDKSKKLSKAEQKNLENLKRAIAKRSQEEMEPPKKLKPPKPVAFKLNTKLADKKQLINKNKKDDVLHKLDMGDSDSDDDVLAPPSVNPQNIRQLSSSQADTSIPKSSQAPLTSQPNPQSSHTKVEPPAPKVTTDDWQLDPIPGLGDEKSKLSKFDLMDTDALLERAKVAQQLAMIQKMKDNELKPNPDPAKAMTGFLSGLSNSSIANETDAAIAMDVSKQLSDALLKYRLENVTELHAGLTSGLPTNQPIYQTPFANESRPATSIPASISVPDDILSKAKLAVANIFGSNPLSLPPQPGPAGYEIDGGPHGDVDIRKPDTDIRPYDPFLDNSQSSGNYGGTEIRMVTSSANDRYGAPCSNYNAPVNYSSSLPSGNYTQQRQAPYNRIVGQQVGQRPLQSSGVFVTPGPAPTSAYTEQSPQLPPSNRNRENAMTDNSGSSHRSPQANLATDDDTLGMAPDQYQEALDQLKETLAAQGQTGFSQEDLKGALKAAMHLKNSEASESNEKSGGRQSQSVNQMRDGKMNTPIQPPQKNTKKETVIARNPSPPPYGINNPSFAAPRPQRPVLMPVQQQPVQLVPVVQQFAPTNPMMQIRPLIPHIPQPRPLGYNPMMRGPYPR